MTKKTSEKEVINELCKIKYFASYNVVCVQKKFYTISYHKRSGFVDGGQFIPFKDEITLDRLLTLKEYDAIRKMVDYYQGRKENEKS